MPMKVIKDTRRLNIIKNLIKDFGHCEVSEFQKEEGLIDDNIFGDKTYQVLYKKVLNPSNVDFNGHYYNTKYPKNQIVIHHTAGWDNVRGVFEWWKNDKVKHVATAVAINDAGELYKGFDEDYWAHHLGVKTAYFNSVSLPNKNVQLNQQSVAIEICNWGRLKKVGNSYVNYLGKVVDVEVSEIEYRGQNYFEKYTDKEIETLKKWILLMSIRHDIPLTYDEESMWTVNANALSGKSGIFTHGSYRPDKDDVSPQPHLIEMLRKIKEYET